MKSTQCRDWATAGAESPATTAVVAIANLGTISHSVSFEAFSVFFEITAEIISGSYGSENPNVFFSCSQSDCRYRFGKGRGLDLDDQIAAVFQLIFCCCGLGLVSDDGHAGFVGPSRVLVEDRQTHRKTFPRLLSPNLPKSSNPARFGKYLAFWS